MQDKPTYDELQQRVRQLEEEKTKLLNSQESVLESGQVYRNLFEHIIYEVHVWELLRDASGAINSWRLVDANPAALKSWGRSLSEIVGKTADQIFPDSKPTEFFRPIVEKIFSDDAPHIWETYFPGTNQYLHMISIPFGNYFITTGLDITERVNAEKNLEEERTFLNAVLDNIQDAIVISDEEGKLIRFNDAARQLHGLPEQPILPDQWAGHYDLYRIDGHTPLPVNETPLFVALQGEKIRNAEIMVAPKNREPHVLICNGQALWDPEGKKIGAVVAMHDVTEQKKAEKALRDSEQRHRLLFENASMGIGYYTTDGTVVALNERALISLGGQLEDYAGKSLVDIFGEDLGATYLERIKKACQTSDILQFEDCVPLPSGNVWFSSAYRRIIDASEELKGVQIIAHDITDIKFAEKEIKESEERFRTLTELSHIGVFLDDAEGKALYINSRCAEIVGVPVDNALNLDWVQYLHPDDRERVVNEWTKAVQNKDSFMQEYRYVHSDGQIVWTRGEASPVKDSQGDVSLFIGTMVDITDLKQAEENQELLTRRLEALWKISSLKNADLKTICDTILEEITQMTGSPYGFYGFLDDLETAMTIHAWSSEAMADCAIHNKPLVFTIEQSGVWGNAVRDRKPFLMNDYREVYVNKTGLPEGHVGLTRVLAVPVIKGDRVIALAAVANKPEDYNDQDIQQLGAFLNNAQIIIDQKQNEEEKTKLEQQLHQAQKIESIGQLAGGVAHDFNNMLGVILGHAELALMKADPDNPFVDNLEEIRTAAKRSADLTRQLLAFARKEAIAPKTLDLNDTVAGLLSMLQRLIGENIHLSWNPEPNLWTVKIDHSQLDQILANLCVNARDAIDDTGTITIETQNCSITEGESKADPEFQPGDYVRLSVSDDGHGIEQEKLNQIFEPFFTTKEFGQGTGLGLSSVYGAVKQNHGFIEVDSEPGAGATFHIYLPRQQTPVESAEETTTAQSLRQGTETILLVEDDQMLLSLTKSMLEESGYAVLAALTVDAALSLAKDHSGLIHLLLSDIVMPEMNGRGLRDQLKPIRPEMKVIFMSGYTADIIAQQGVIEEGIHFLQKPVSHEALTSKVRDVLDQD